MLRLITLMTDFGTADGYAAEMKGLLYARVPGATIVDVSHDIPAHDVEAARLALERYWRDFPPSTVHLVVVDPGVGSSRAAIAVESDHRLLVGPDNGVLSPALVVPDARVVELPEPPGASATFHGLDLFAPVAAALAIGTPIEQMGTPFGRAIVRRSPEPQRRTDGALVGEIVTIDRFGNAITNLPGPKGPATLECAGRHLAVVRTYADVAPGEATALVGSGGSIEIAVRDASAADHLGLSRGLTVVLRP